MKKYMRFLLIIAFICNLSARSFASQQNAKIAFPTLIGEADLKEIETLSKSKSDVVSTLSKMNFTDANDGLKKLGIMIFFSVPGNAEFIAAVKYILEAKSGDGIEAIIHSKLEVVKKNLKESINDVETKNTFWKIFRGLLCANTLLVKSNVEILNDSLLWAVKYGYLKFAEIFLKAGAIVNCVDELGNTPLYYAAGSGNIESMRLLFSAGAGITIQNKNKETALHVAAHNGQVPAAEFLLGNGASIEEENIYGHTPLNEAAMKGQVEVVKLLTNPKYHKVNEKYAEIILKLNKTDMGNVKLVVTPKYRIHKEDKSLSLILASQNEQYDVVKLLLKDKEVQIDFQDRAGNTALHYAAKNQNADIFYLLLKNRAKVNLENKRKNTALMLLSWETVDKLKNLGVNNLNMTKSYDTEDMSIGLLENIKTGNLTTVARDLKYGADVNYRSAAGEKPLVVAITKGYLKIAEMLIQAGARLDTDVDANKNTILHYAAYKGHFNSVKLLISAGADLNLKNNQGQTALDFARQFGKTEIVKLILEQNNKDNKLLESIESENLELVKQLLESGANVNCYDKQKTTPLISAAFKGNAKIAKMFIDAGANVNAKDLNRNMAIHVAISKGNIEVVKVLLQSDKLYLSVADNNGYTPLILASAFKNFEMVELLLSKNPGIGFQDNNGNTALHWATVNNTKDIVSILISARANINKQNNKGFTALHYAVEKGFVEIVKQLLAAGADLGIVDNEGNTALDIARESGETEIVQLLVNVLNVTLLKFIKAGDLDAVNQLIELGANPDYNDADGDTPLLLAVFKNHIEIVKVLLEKGVRVNISDPTGTTLLHFAAGNGYTEIAKLLLIAGADIGLKNNQGQTAFDFANKYKKPEIVQLILEQNNKDNELLDAIEAGNLNLVKQLLAAGANPNSYDDNKNPHAVFAVCKGYAEILAELINHGTSIGYVTDTGLTFLHYAAGNGYTEIAELLLKAGININAQNKKGNTPLHLAALKGHKEVVELLLRAGANFNIKNADGKTAIQIAQTKGYADIVELIQSVAPTSTLEPILEMSEDIKSNEVLKNLTSILEKTFGLKITENLLNSLNDLLSIEQGMDKDFGIDRLMQMRAMGI